jgi:hypothetical protein
MAALITVCAAETLLYPQEYAWRMFYAKAQNNKAMAIAENGAMGFSTGQSFLATAEAQAMDTCTAHSKYLSLRQPETPPCRLLTSADKWHLPELQVDSKWQQPSEGKDSPLRKGRKYLVATGTSKAIILHVHGCDGLGFKLFTDVWGAYFNALGYDFYAPDGFVEKRPKPVCGLLGDFPARQISDVWHLRVAQTQRTLAELRKANPGKPIYLWGHSEGGLIVQMIETTVAGIIVSGEECGVVGAPIAASDAVPLLYIWGEFDQYVNGIGFRITSASTSKCATDFASHKPQFAVLEGRSHNPWPWNAKVNQAIATFLNEKLPAKVAPFPINKKLAANWKRGKPDKRYRNAPPHRAAAISKSGYSYMVWGLDNTEDATQLALFGCTRSTSSKVNVYKTGKYLCAVVDVNGAAPK